MSSVKKSMSKIQVGLKLKLTLWFMLIMAIVSSCLVGVVLGISENVVIKEQEKELVSSVVGFKQNVEAFGMTNKEIPSHLLFNKGIQMVVLDENMNIVVGQRPFGVDENFDFADDTLQLEKYNGKEYYIYDKLFKIDSVLQKEYWVRGMVCLSDELATNKIVAKFYIIFIIIFVLVAGAGCYYIVGRSLSMVKKIRKTAKKISESGDLSQRIDVDEDGDELHKLAETFNGMIEKLDESFKKEKQFTSDASHELRTPISVILTECEYGEDCVEKVEDFKECISSIKNQANKMSKLVSELLMISRMDNDRLKLNFEETDVSELLEFVCEEQVEIHNDEVILTQNIDKDVIGKVDRSLITRLFVNLISNAYQYIGQGNSIVVSLNKENDKIRFSVKDNGVGISEENISKIWDRFYQVDSSRTADGNGSSGLGLSMVKWIAETHNGKLEVNSELGKGSEFIFVF